MIIIKVQGGLGNQIFQYAFGRLLEIQYKKEVAYDLSFFDNAGTYTVRPFLLDKFKTKMRIASKEEINEVKYPYGVISYLIFFSKKVFNKFFTKKYQIAFDRSLVPSFKNKTTAYCEGYWQSYKYVYPIIIQLKKELILKDNASEKMTRYTKLIKNLSLSVAIHIRRGDYVTTAKDLQVLEKEYYQNALKNIQIKEKGLLSFFIFSDDISWVKNELGDLFHNAVYVEGLKDYEEMMLISYCNYIITANSTFSWWGAVLSLTENSHIIAPKDWKNIHFKHDNNLCPPEWVRI